MSDLIEATKRSETVTIDGTDYELKPLSCYEIAGLVKAERKLQREQLVQNLKDAEIKGDEFFLALNSFDRERLTQADWIEYVNDIRSDYDICRVSLKKSGVADAKADELAKKVLPSMATKAYLCSLAVVTPQLPMEGTVDPKTGNPLAYSTPEELENGSLQAGSSNEIESNTTTSKSETLSNSRQPSLSGV